MKEGKILILDEADRTKNDLTADILLYDFVIAVGKDGATTVLKNKYGVEGDICDEPQIGGFLDYKAAGPEKIDALIKEREKEEIKTMVKLFHKEAAQNMTKRVDTGVTYDVYRFLPSKDLADKISKHKTRFDSEIASAYKAEGWDSVTLLSSSYSFFIEFRKNKIQNHEITDCLSGTTYPIEPSFFLTDVTLQNLLKTRLPF